MLTLRCALASRRDRDRVALELAAELEVLGDLPEVESARLQQITRNAAAAASLGTVAVLSAARDEARSILERAEAASVRVITAFDEGYPERLRDVSDHPAVVYLKGADLSWERTVACVGTRSPSRFGEVVTRRLATLMAEGGWTIVSGLALGVDALAHRAALDAGGVTVAVLGNGLDRVFPRQNSRLASEVVAGGGALLSEQPPGTEVSRSRLVLRDRLQSGLAAAVVLLQSDLSGGAMHTVRYALRQGRPIFAPVPTGRYAHEREARGVLAVAGATGAELATKLSARGELERLLTGELAKERPITPIRGREDYPALLEMLERLAS